MAVPLKSVGKSPQIECLWLGAVVGLDGLVCTVTVVSVTLAAPAADGHRVGEIRSNVAWASWYLHSSVDEVSVCANILGERVFGKKQLAVDILWKVKGS